MQQPGFWDDQQKAAAVSTEHRRATRRLLVRLRQLGLETAAA